MEIASLHSYLGLKITMRDDGVKIDMSFNAQKMIQEYPIKVIDRDTPIKSNVFWYRIMKIIGGTIIMLYLRCSM
jgi:hypothetical protein